MNRTPIAILALAMLGAACSSSASAPTTTSSASPTTSSSSTSGLPTTSTPGPTASTSDPSIGTGPNGSGPGVNVYAHTLLTSDIQPRLANIPVRVYVPNQVSATLDEIDPTTYQIVAHYSLGKNPQHVVAQWDLNMLYATTSGANTVTPIDPLSGKPGTPIPVTDAYNVYFAPDGSKAIVMVEAYDRLDTFDYHTWKKLSSTDTGCRGVNHADFTADGKTMLATCEFSGDVIKVDLATMTVTGKVHLGGIMVDVKLAPDGTYFFVANESERKISLIDPVSMKEVGSIRTDLGTHGLYPSRDATKLYATNRTSGTISVIDIATRTVTATWHIGGTPDMGAVSADGKEFWISGRQDGVVYVIDTTTGKVTHKIKVGSGPHGITIFPLPGRYSMGHTDNYR